MLTSTRSAIVLKIHVESWLSQSRKHYLHKSVIRGHKAVWTPVLGEVHCLALEEGNEHDRFPVCVKRDEIIGHVPRALTFTEDFTNNTEFNKCRSRLVAALE